MRLTPTLQFIGKTKKKRDNCNTGCKETVCQETVTVQGNCNTVYKECKIALVRRADRYRNEVGEG